MEVAEVKRLRELQGENRRLKRLMAVRDLERRHERAPLKKAVQAQERLHAGRQDYTIRRRRGLQCPQHINTNSEILTFPVVLKMGAGHSKPPCLVAQHAVDANKRCWDDL